MKKHSPSDKTKSASPEFRDWKPSEIPIAPDGGIAPGFATNGPSLPVLTSETTICLRGPCRHYWEMKVEADAGNPDGTWEHLGVAKPCHLIRTCLANPGHETDLADTAVLECNRWTPRDLQVLDVQTDDTYMRIMTAGAGGWSRGQHETVLVYVDTDGWQREEPLQWVGPVLLVPRSLWDGSARATVMTCNHILMEKRPQ